MPTCPISTSCANCSKPSIHKRDLLHLFDQCLHAEWRADIRRRGVRLRGVLEGCSVVTAPYTVEGQVLGVLGVIGPTRMAYDRVIPVVDVTARLLAAALNGQGN
jgi:heat-inducible transcriptional repressor